MKVLLINDLIPNNGRRSFYGKAKVLKAKNYNLLRSYDTIVCGVDANGNIHRYFDIRSKTNTTCAHLKSFLGCAYKNYWNLPVEKAPTLTI